jgi:hypothetical protein
MRLARGYEILGAAAVALVTSQAGAADRPAPAIGVRTPGAADCPTQSELVSAVERRLLPSSVVDPAQRFDVTIEPTARGLSARLVVRDAKGASAERVVEAERCADVFDTLAFIVAMTIDPKTAEQPALESAAALAAVAPPQDLQATTAQPAASAPTPPEEGATPVAPLAAPEAARKDRSPEPSPLLTKNPGFELGLLVEGTTAVAPGVTPGGRLFGGLRLPSVGVVYPSFRLSAARSTERTAQVDEDRGGYLTVTSGRLEACASSGFGSRRFVVDLCPAADLGVRDGKGYGVEPVRTPARTWFAFDLLGRLGFLAGDWVLFQAEGGLVIPVTRDTFTLTGPDAEVFETPALALTFGGGMAVRLP